MSNTNYLHGRSLLSDDDRILIAFALIILFLGIHFLANFIFVLIYYFKIIEADNMLKI